MGGEFFNLHAFFFVKACVEISFSDLQECFPQFRFVGIFFRASLLARFYCFLFQPPPPPPPPLPITFVMVRPLERKYVLALNYIYINTLVLV